MPQADRVLTIATETPPTGFLADISPVHATLVEAAQIRLDGLSALLFLVKTSDQVPQFIASALMGIETGINDVIDLLSVVPGAATGLSGAKSGQEVLA